MYTKSKLRSKQDPNKFEQIYAELENIYNIRLKDKENERNKKANSLNPIIIINLVIAIAMLYFAVKHQQDILVGFAFIPVTFMIICLIIHIRKYSRLRVFKRIQKSYFRTANTNIW